MVSMSCSAESLILSLPLRPAIESSSSVAVITSPLEVPMHWSVPRKSYPRRYASRYRQRGFVEEDETIWDELETIVWLVEPDEVEEDWIEEEKPPLE
jgi:hypothetical protein